MLLFLIIIIKASLLFDEMDVEDNKNEDNGLNLVTLLSSILKRKRKGEREEDTHIV